MEVPQANQQPIRALLQKLEELQCDFSRDVGATVTPCVTACLEDSSADAWLLAVFESFGWVGSRFTRPVDLRIFTSRLKALMFDGLQQKGQGSFATVYKARDRLTGEVITLKKVKVDEHGTEGLSGAAIREVSLLKDLHHPNIVKLKDVLWDSRRLYLIMEYLDYDLQEHIASSKHKLAPAEVKVLLHQLLSGLQFCHSHLILHRDLKPQNILVDRTSKLLKIADFGLARCFTPPPRAYTHEVVTLLYRAPELLLGSAVYSTPVDMWSVGCIFAELFLGQALFQGDSEIGQLFKIFEVLGTPDDSMWPGVTKLPDWQPQFPMWPGKDLHECIPRMDVLGLDLLRQLLRYDPAQRISASRALRHDYFGGMRPSPTKAAAADGQQAPPGRVPSMEAPAAALPHPAPAESPQASPEGRAAPVAPSIKAIKLRDVCRSHSDPGLQRGLADRPRGGPGRGGSPEAPRGRAHEQQQQQQPSRSASHRATETAGQGKGRTMQTRSMTAAQEAAQGLGTHSTEATGPLHTQLAQEQPSADGKPAAAGAASSEPDSSIGRHKGKAKGKLAEGKRTVGTGEPVAAPVKGGDAGGPAASSRPTDSSDASEQTACDVAEEVAPRRKSKA